MYKEAPASSLRFTCKTGDSPYRHRRLFLRGRDGSSGDVAFSRVKIEVMSHSDPAHRYHILLTTFTAVLLVPARHCRHGTIVPCLMALGVTRKCRSSNGAPAEGAGSIGLFCIRESLRAGSVAGGATFGEVGTEAGREMLAEEGAQDRETGAEDTDIGFNVEP